MGNGQNKRAIQDKEVDEECKKQASKDSMTQLKQNSIDEEHSPQDEEHLEKQLNFSIKPQRKAKPPKSQQKKQQLEIQEFQQSSQMIIQQTHEQQPHGQQKQITKASDKIHLAQYQLQQQETHHQTMIITQQIVQASVKNQQLHQDMSQYEMKKQQIQQPLQQQQNLLITTLKQQEVAKEQVACDQMDVEKIITFSRQFKSKTIWLDEGCKLVKQDGLYYENQKLVLSEPITLKRAEARFRITNLKYCLGAGIALKEIIEKHSYNYKSYENELSHGLFLLTTQGYSWSHSYKSQDDQFYPGFKKLKNGDVIEVRLDYGRLGFRFKEQQFSLQIPESVLKNYTICFVGYLHERSDSLSLQQF